MFRPERGTSRRAVWRRPSAGNLGLAALAAGAAIAVPSPTLAAGGPPTLGAARNPTLGRMIVVDAHGRTVYALTPESTRHLLCRSSECLAAWRPVFVRSQAVTLRGIIGHLRLLRRSNGKLQVTLRGMPLYTFAGDGAKGQANGERIRSFGGTWHTVPATVSQAMTPASPPGPSTPSAPPPAYTPPGY